MGVICTLFSVTDADVSAPSELTLPAADHTSKVGTMREPHLAELGAAWSVLHEALGAHPAGHPLGFLAGGGAPFKPLFDGQGSSGRHFTPAETVKLLAAVARITDDAIVRNVATRQITALSLGELLRKLTELRVFLAETVAQDRGIIVHHLR